MLFERHPEQPFAPPDYVAFTPWKAVRGEEKREAIGNRLRPWGLDSRPGLGDVVDRARPNLIRFKGDGRGNEKLSALGPALLVANGRLCWLGHEG